MDRNRYKIDTILAHLSENGGIKDPFGSSHMPIYQTATFDLKKQGDNPYDYTRSGNPTRESLENLLSKVCSGVGAVLTHTGLGSIALLFESFLRVNDHILVDKDTYGGTFRLLKYYRDRMNITLHFVDFLDLEKVENKLKSNPISIVLIESPTNPGLKILDLQQVGLLTKKYKTIFAVDNSLATFVSQRPLELGADISLFSTTKYVSGHGAVIGGAIVSNNKNLLKEIKYTANAQGRSQNPMDVHTISLGIPTLPIRLKAHQDSALKLATWLENHPRVKRVVYPGLKSHPQYETAKKQMSYFNGVLTVDFESEELALRVVEETILFSEKCSFGTADSRIESPGKISHASFTSDELREIGINPETLRISVGLEDIDDLIDDLKGIIGE
ncbi:PLP-dependent transferase [Thiospirochaeta perfilievii]|uniref:PLP-dependent transferase n=1 Tax=Thiospirochaeta perfilievii TaxID=252967 RepID=A0A5C1QC34_9SPIO|nr:aminotransferase class I/II-fold pyridoxal phosphate-dependent enzyme [Thiospirochaeta perfilievii]QEN04234.1 PLP-dependent transferase [Thiospirochaeta perfilievii]